MEEVIETIQIDGQINGQHLIGQESFEIYEDALKNCIWDWHLIEDEDERETARKTYVTMEENAIALKISYTNNNTIDAVGMKKIANLYNKYAPEKYRRP